MRVFAHSLELVWRALGLVDGLDGPEITVQRCATPLAVLGSWRRIIVGFGRKVGSMEAGNAEEGAYDRTGLRSSSESAVSGSAGKTAVSGRSATSSAGKSPVSVCIGSN